MGALVQDRNPRGRNPHNFAPRHGNPGPYMMRPRGPFPPPGPPMPMGMRPMMRPMPSPPRGPRMGPRPRGPMMGPRMPRMRPPLPPPMYFRPRPPPPMRGRWFGGGVRGGRVAKRRKAELDLSAEWVTEALRAEFKRKDELLGAAKAAGPDDKEAWAAYRAQRERCGQMYHAASVEAVGRQRQRQEVEDDSNKDTGAKTTKNLQSNNETSQPPAETTKAEVATS